MKNRKIMKTILGCLYVLPFVAVLGLTAYATFNDNAKDSYSGSKTDAETYTQENIHDFNVGDYVYINTNGQEMINRSGNDFYLNVSNVKFRDVYYPTATKLQIYSYPANTSNQMYITIREGTTQLYSTQIQNTSYTGSFTFLGIDTENTIYSDNLTIFYSVIFKDNFYLDNAFEYGIDKFNDLGFEKMGFMQYFTDLFVTTPNRYTTFINSYFNYFLLVTCVSVLPRVLYWFIEWSLSFTERFTRKD